MASARSTPFPSFFIIKPFIQIQTRYGSFADSLRFLGLFVTSFQTTPSFSYGRATKAKPFSLLPKLRRMVGSPPCHLACGCSGLYLVCHSLSPSGPVGQSYFPDMSHPHCHVTHRTETKRPYTFGTTW